MKLLAAAVALLVVSTALAAPAPPEGPVTMTSKHGNVVFQHKVHAFAACQSCHPPQLKNREGNVAVLRDRAGNEVLLGTPGRIGFTKDSAHALCVECHKVDARGPTKCHECHDKKA